MTDTMPDAAVEKIMDAMVPASQRKGNPGHDDAEWMARRIKAVTMKIAGMTYEQIANEAGYSDKSTARKVVLAALDRVESDRVDELRGVENARLDRAQAAIWSQVLGGDVKAVDTFLRLSARRARMNGLDAPQQVTVTPGTAAGLEDALADLRETVMGEVVVDGSG